MTTDISKYEKEIQELDNFKELEPDWNSYGSLPISHEIIEIVKQFYRRLYEQLGDVGDITAVLMAYPCADGGLQLEADFAPYFIELEFTPGQGICVLVGNKDGERRGGEFDFDSAELVKAVAQWYLHKGNGWMNLFPDKIK